MPENEIKRELESTFENQERSLRSLIMPSDPKKLKRLGTKRRRIRNRYNGVENISEIDITLSCYRSLIGMQMKVRSKTGEKGFTGTENYFKTTLDRNGENAIIMTLVLLMRLMLQTVRITIYYDGLKIKSPYSSQNIAMKTLLKDFDKLKFVECSKGYHIDKLRQKLTDLGLKPGNEIAEENIDELIKKIVESPYASNESAQKFDSVPSAIDPNTDRGALLTVAKFFLEKIKHVENIEKVAFCGSICTNKKHPKDLDVIVYITPETDMKRLSVLQRKTMGRIQRGSLGFDLFIVQEGKFIGRACSYKEPWVRVVCAQNGNRCNRERLFLCDLTNNFTLSKDLVENPPIIIYPELKSTCQIPADLKTVLDGL